MNILIVESAAKARTLGRYLGKGWKVLATGGHVQTLPGDRKLHGKDASKAYWASREGELPKPPWVWTDRGEKAVQAIMDASDNPTYWLAPDPDREGEFIAWRLQELLKGRGPIHRVTFNEVTAEAVRAAVDSPRALDMQMVQSALVRKYLDRLVGFRTSKLARGMLSGSGASMGRVQTPALGFVVDRELEREAHVPIAYFEVRVDAAEILFQVRFTNRNDPNAWRDEAGKAHANRTADGDLAAKATTALREASHLEIQESVTRDRSNKPRPPLTTDALLQAGGSRFGWSPKKTSALASMLYEAGHITYIRTDSTRLAETAIAAARTAIEKSWGASYLSTSKAVQIQKGKGPVQDAHEAIRPTHLESAEVDVGDNDAHTLYRLIRAYVLASQMVPSTRRTVQITAGVPGLELPLRGSISWRTFAGWEAAFAAFQTAGAEAPPELDVSAGQHLAIDAAKKDLANPRCIEDATKPPSRYRAHTLIKAMKDAGIGRPSTYAKTVEKLENRTYITSEGGALVTTPRGRPAWLRVAPLYVENDGSADLFSAEFTAEMEERLDAVARGEQPAGETWTTWRDQIRVLHDLARQRRKEGQATPRTQDRLRRLLENAPASFERPADPSSFTEAKIRELISELMEAGIEAAPTEKQRAYVARLMEELSMSDTEAAALIDQPNMEAIRTSVAMSSLTEQLKALHDERRPPSKKQMGLIGRLIEKAGLTEGDAVALVEVESIDKLTGGRSGSASALIDQLLERTKKKKSDDKKAT